MCPLIVRRTRSLLFLKFRSPKGKFCGTNVCVLQNSHLLHLEIWQVFKGLSWTETHYFSLQRPPAPFPYETHILLNIPLLTLPRTFSGFKLCSWCTWSNLFWTSLVQKNCTIYFWLFVFLMFVNLYRSQRSCENLLKYPAWKYLLKEHAPHF